MALQFQKPFELQQAPTKTEALLAPIGKAVSTIPSMIMEYDQLKKQRAMEGKKMTLEEAKLALEIEKAKRQQSYYDTGLDGKPVLKTTPGIDVGTKFDPNSGLVIPEGAVPPQDAPKAPLGGSSGTRPIKMIAGFDPDTMRPVYRDSRAGELRYSDDDSTYTNPKQLVPLAGRMLPEGASQKLGDFETLQFQLSNVVKNYSPEYVGMLDRVGSAVKLKTGAGATEQLSNFMSNLNGVRNTLLYMRSGAQINESEFNRLVKELPDEKTSDTDFEARLKNFSSVLSEIVSNRVASYGKSGFVTPNKPQEGFDDLKKLGLVK